MLKEFKQHIDQNFPFLENSTLLVAISGGIDSVVLTHLMNELGFNFSLCHCNFQLRGNESHTDEGFVKTLGERLGRQVFTTSFETEKYATKNKVSIQVAARDLRYQWFQSLIEKHSFDFVLTAHNSNDNLETFLINLTRGTGLDGLTGIPSINKKTVRPLLTTSREDIEKYALINDISWCEDKSNASTKYVRNKIRHQVIPTLKEINPSILDTFQNTLEHLNESQQIVNDHIQELSKELLITEGSLIKIDISKVNKLENKKAYLYELLHSYGFTEWNDVLSLLTSQSGKYVSSSTHRLIKNREYLLLTDAKIDSEVYLIEEGTNEIKNPIHLTFETSDIKNLNDANETTIYLDKEAIKFPLTLRKWQKGDVFYPIGMKGKKKLSKFFKDEKYSIIEKENTWLLCSENNILWIIGKRQDRRLIANNNSSIITKIHLTN